ncbi:glycosyltransferase family 4 protein [Virgibacillus dokdonensis]|uniref:N, N'-diacetylbacillosaminyl-diphospho-undecaprenol alpha-1,3-N-acetylgalactosaminyltransferase n=1 Tax=Virgibacillus dokdonensis TaxID=302167 RepID=A0A2K9IV74_9BACI|nr:glycosyltransferase family 4 protein [Virgibacillus dokdonensis]AUJ23656.1 N,N'-diacetylbacillosaminyl-diphospho-undecaprenol alpha-1,3-N-acetylgalactosaminyltransferase [Virgibacillus dokdonensis]
MKKVLILSNHHSYTYNFRKEVIQELIDNGYKVYIVLPYGEKVELLKEMGCEFIDLPLDRRGMNPLKDIALFFNYIKIIKQIKPQAVLSYTIKPNIYGGLACRLLKIPFYPNITGLGSAVENDSFLQKILIKLYRVAYKNAKCVFFQNKDNLNFFIENKIKIKKYKVIPGSGVNINDFHLLEYPETGKNISFVFISRIMKEKGIDQYLEAASYIKEKYPETRFHVLGYCEESYEEKLKDMENQGVIEYHGMQDDVRKFLRITHCTIHPTYYPEGMSNVLLESAASGRPIITTKRSGCKEIVNHKVNGYIAEPKNSKDLIEKIETFLALCFAEKEEMGLKARKKIEEEFNRDIVVKNYIDEIKSLD